MAAPVSDRMPTIPVAKPPAEAGRSPVSAKIGYYAIGVAIGFILLGVVTMGKRALMPAKPGVPGPAAQPTPAPEPKP